MNESPDPAPRSGLPQCGVPQQRVEGCEIYLQNPCGYSEAGARRIRPWLTPVVEMLAPDAAELSVRFVSDREMRRLNMGYRHKDKSTDVLSFVGDYPPAEDRGFVADAPAPSNDDISWPMPDHESPEGVPDLFADSGFLGDVVISVPTARRQAAARGHSVEREIRILLLHGLLHCLGYDHEVDDGTMERKEMQLRARLGIEALGPSSSTEPKAVMGSAS